MKDVRSKIPWLRWLPTLGLPILALFIVSAPQAQADAPCAARYSVPMDGTVLDTETKLTWQQEVDSMLRSWSDAKGYCEGLTLAGGSWALPTAFELQTIVDESRASPAIDGTAFPKTPANNFWSSTALSDTSQGPKAWHVEFQRGQAFVDSMAFEYYVRCVKKKP